MKYTQGQMSRNLLGAFLLPIVWLLGAWHLAESTCQAEHNVSDCELTEALFVPAEQ